MRKYIEDLLCKLGFHKWEFDKLYNGRLDPFHYVCKRYGEYRKWYE